MPIATNPGPASVNTPAVALTSPALPAIAEAGLWQRLAQFALLISPQWMRELDKHRLLGVSAWTLLAFVVVLLMPHLSVLSVRLVAWALPNEAGNEIRKIYIHAIHKGYDIDKVADDIKIAASKDALEKLQKNNESLDYVQYVEFYLVKGDQPKEIPASLRLEQRAKISIRRSQIVRIADATDTACMLPEVGTSEHVLDVLLDGLKIASLTAMASPGKMGEINLSKAWWKGHLDEAKKEPTIADNIASVRFGKPAAFEVRMTPCTAIKVEATVEVYKRDVGANL